MTSLSSSNNTLKKELRIALGFPEWDPFYQVMNGQPADATYVIQGNLSKGLVGRGHSLLFIAPNNVNDFIFTADASNAKVASRSWSSGFLFELISKGIWRFQKIFGVPYLNFFSNYRFLDAAMQNLHDVDIIYERNGLYNVGLAMASQRLKLPYVVFFEADQIMELDVMNRPITGLLRWRAEQILRYNLKVADCIICVTDVGKNHLVENWGIPTKKIVVFPNAVHVDRFKPDANIKADIRGALGITEDTPMIMFVGNFFHWHDVSTLLKAFAKTLDVCPSARLVLVGDGERRSEMARQVTDLDLDYAVKFTGIVPHAKVPHYMASADIAVVPYPPMQKMWLSPLKLFEYMSAGKAIVASSVGQIVDVIHDGENGLLVPPGDVSAMSDALIKLIQDANLRSQLGQHAREDAVHKFSWDSYLTRLEQVFDAVITHKPVEKL